MGATQSELRLARLIDERETATQLHEGLLADVEKRDEKAMTDTERTQVTAYRERAKDLDEEIASLAETVEGNNRSIEQSKKIRRALSGNTDGIDEDGDGVVYRTMASYARDVILTGNGREAAKIKGQLGDKQEVERAEQRLQLLKRTPANTLSGDVPGLIPDQHIAQIFQVIDSSRPLVASAQSTTLVRGTLSYPNITSSPIVSVQASEKTEAGNVGLDVAMVTATASTYLGGGDLSLAGHQLVDPGRAGLVVPARRGRLRPEDRAGRRAGDAALGLLEQHRLDAGGDPDLRPVHDGGRRRLRRGVRELGTPGGHDLHGARPLRVHARPDLGCVHAVHERLPVGRRPALGRRLPRHGLGRDRGR